MPRLRLALAQVNPTVGDLTGNAALVRDGCRRAAGTGAHLVAFPELVLTGYPVEDLVFRESFVAASREALHRLAGDLAADGLGELPAIVGYLDADGPVHAGADASRTAGPRNAAAVLHRGQVVCRYAKHHLPNYGVFDEDRYFVPGDTLTVVRLGRSGDAADVALTICEDLWQEGGPFAVARAAGVGLVVTINGSPYELAKDDVRLPLVAHRASEAGASVAYVNMVGGQDELIFDGDSLIVTAAGRVLARGGQFDERQLVHDLDLPPAGDGRTGPAGGMVPGDGMRVQRVEVPAPLDPPAGPPADAGVATPLDGEAQVWQALVLALRDYTRKNGFASVVLGLSGGIDSAVVAALAVDALGPEQVVGLGMPSRHTPEHSLADAAELATRTGLDYRVEPVQAIVDTYLAQLSLSGVAVENLQARVRGVVVMAISNQEGHLALTTGNKSELAVGYSTLYGDSVGGFAPLKDVPKTMVWRLASWRNAAAGQDGEVAPIPERAISRPPSAELRPGQRDTDSLPPYEQLDALLADYVDRDLGRDALVAAGHDPATVDRLLRMVDTAEHKRRQSAPGPKISIKAFGRDRRLPVTNRFRDPPAPSERPV